MGLVQYVLMTLTIAWVRKVDDTKELVVASDSRLTGGMAWDGCPKIMMLPRGDCLLAFGGPTYFAYPLMLQFRNWVELDPRARSRERDIVTLKKRMRLMFMDMRSHISSLPRGQLDAEPYDFDLIFGGWSWRSLEFRLWSFQWAEAEKVFNFAPAGSSLRVSQHHPTVFAGTRAATEDARDRIIALLRERGRFQTPYYDMEPFEVLRDIIREGRYPDVGGAPQLAKIYQHGNTQPFAVSWRSQGETQPRVTILGRPLFAGERTMAPIVDADQIEFRNVKTLRKRTRLSAEK